MQCEHIPAKRKWSFSSFLFVCHPESELTENKRRQRQNYRVKFHRNMLREDRAVNFGSTQHV